MKILLLTTLLLFAYDSNWENGSQTDRVVKKKSTRIGSTALIRFRCRTASKQMTLSMFISNIINSSAVMR